MKNKSDDNLTFLLTKTLKSIECWKANIKVFKFLEEGADLKDRATYLAKEMKEFRDIIKRRELKDDNFLDKIFSEKVRNRILETLDTLIPLLEFKSDWIDEEEYGAIIIAWQEIKNIPLEKLVKPLFDWA